MAPPINYEEIDIVRGQAVARAYVSRFLRWHVYGEAQHRWAFVAPTGSVAGVAAFPDEILEGEVDSQIVDLWHPLYTQAPYAALGARPVMLPMFSQGVDPEIPGLGLPPRHRLRIDTMYRDPALACGHQDQPLILSPSSPLEADVARIGLAEEDVCLAEAIGQTLPHHDTHAMRLDWGQAAFGHGVRWTVTEELDAYSHLSVRMAKRRTGMGTTAPLSVRFQIETEAIDDDGSFPVSASVDYTRVLNADLTAPTSSALSMHTVRVPFDAFMSVQPIDFARPRSVSLLVPDTQNGGAFLHVDSLETTRHPQDSTAFAPSPAAYWACEADGRLTVREFSCAEAPAEGGCPVQSEVVKPLDLPHVNIGAGWDGWLIDTIPGWLDDPDNPSMLELERIALRCETACRRHYSGYPAEVVALCEAENFVAPYRVTATGSRTRRSIPDAARDGSGLIGSATLTCDLLDSCWCESFTSPEICGGAPMRVTMAQEALGRGEQWVVEVEGAVSVEAVESMTQGDAGLIGQVGFSLCDPTSSTCPYYLGSAHFETTEPLELELDCGGQPVVHTIDSLHVDLVQPAMGIETDGSIAFPAGAVVFRTTATSGQLVHVVERPNAQPFVYAASMLQSQTEFSFEVSLGVLCGGELEQVTATLGFDVTGLVHAPPAVTIDVPDWIICPNYIHLENDVTVTDPDNDVESIRWRIHEHLMGENVQQLLVDGYLGEIPVEVTACDARGGCTRATKTVQCVPLAP